MSYARYIQSFPFTKCHLEQKFIDRKTYLNYHYSVLMDCSIEQHVFLSMVYIAHQYRSTIQPPQNPH